MEYILKPNDFITETTPMYSDPEGDNPLKIKIVTLPKKGSLTYNGVPVSDEQVFIYPIDLTRLELKFIADTNTIGAHTDYIRFKAADVGSELYSNIGTITFKMPRQFNPPTVDDNSDILDNKIYVYKESDFTKNFEDIDGDGYSTVTIKETTGVGELRINGAVIQEGVEFDATESDDLEFHLTDNYAIYDGKVYRFDNNIETIILDYENADYKLIDNTNGVLTFGKGGGDFDTKTLSGVLVDNESLCLEFTIKDDSERNSESNKAEFCLIPQGDINIKPIFVNQPPTVGDNDIYL